MQVWMARLSQGTGCGTWTRCGGLCRGLMDRRVERPSGLDSGEACGKAYWVDRLDVLQKESMCGSSKVSLD